jgi:hypothetical protein
MSLQQNDLESSNKIILDHLKEFDHSVYRTQKAIYFVNRAYSLKRKSERFTLGILFLIRAFILSPAKVLKYFSVKFLGTN